jgi:hypothetical protein
MYGIWDFYAARASGGLKAHSNTKADKTAVLLGLNIVSVEVKPKHTRDLSGAGHDRRRLMASKAAIEQGAKAARFTSNACTRRTHLSASLRITSAEASGARISHECRTQASKLAVTVTVPPKFQTTVTSHKPAWQVSEGGIPR